MAIISHASCKCFTLPARPLVYACPACFCMRNVNSSSNFT